jgi:hypothetical protein
MEQMKRKKVKNEQSFACKKEEKRESEAIHLPSIINY